jgi:hypothetical protein
MAEVAVPRAFTATTENWYVVPAANPVIVADRPAVGLPNGVQAVTPDTRYCGW